MNLFSKLIAPYSRRIRLMVGRGVVNIVNDALKIQGLQISLLADEVRGNVERFQEYGFTSHPHPGAEVIALSVGGSRDHCVVIKVDDRRYRLKGLAQGEMAIYSDEGDKVHLKRNKEINIHSGGKVMVDAAVLIDMKVGTPTKGVVQGDCICHFTGLPHGDLSTTVMASKG